MDCGCECGSECGSFRAFPTKEEKIERLRSYRETLEKELRGVSEKIAELQK